MEESFLLKIFTQLLIFFQFWPAHICTHAKENMQIVNNEMDFMTL